MIKPNLGNIDRAVRIVAGICVLGLAFVGPHTPWAYIGIVPLLTGAVGFCPAYCPFGLTTCRVPKQ